MLQIETSDQCGLFNEFIMSDIKGKMSCQNIKNEISQEDQQAWYKLTSQPGSISYVATIVECQEYVYDLDIINKIAHSLRFQQYTSWCTNDNQFVNVKIGTMLDFNIRGQGMNRSYNKQFPSQCNEMNPSTYIVNGEEYNRAHNTEKIVEIVKLSNNYLNLENIFKVIDLPKRIKILPKNHITDTENKTACINLNATRLIFPIFRNKNLLESVSSTLSNRYTPCGNLVYISNAKNIQNKSPKSIRTLSIGMLLRKKKLKKHLEIKETYMEANTFMTNLNSRCDVMKIIHKTIAGKDEFDNHNDKVKMKTFVAIFEDYLLIHGLIYYDTTRPNIKNNFGQKSFEDWKDDIEKHGGEAFYGKFPSMDSIPKKVK